MSEINNSSIMKNLYNGVLFIITNFLLGGLGALMPLLLAIKYLNPLLIIHNIWITAILQSILDLLIFFELTRLIYPYIERWTIYIFDKFSYPINN